MTRVGFIGLGVVGQPMARNLLRAGHALVVHDLRPEAGAALVAEGATWAARPADVAVASEVVFTSLPGPPEVETVALGEAGILAAAPPGLVYLDTSTTGPTCIRRVAAAAAGRGVSVLDVAISQGPGRAEQADLSLWVGGDEAVYERVRPLLAAVGRHLIYCGPVGSGQITKLVNNLTAQALNVVLGEALCLGVKAGVPLETLCAALATGTAQTRKLDELFPRGLFRGDFAPGFRLDLAAKDVRLATDLGRELALSLPLANLVDQTFVAAQHAGLGPLANHAVVRLVEQAADVALRYADASP
ncbi:MAG TPA: NAD(P)-dependent oxidoreductase [Chloroflexota bacterium]|jgi:3-hydroxyisobutyrate dehydrogenase-like beta-hydroxyacid dehydrogenase